MTDQTNDNFADSHLALNEAFLEVEDALQDMALKAPAEVSLGFFKYKHQHVQALLCFRLGQDGWQLSKDPKTGKTSDCAAITSAPYIFKAAAVGKMDELLAVIRENRQLQARTNFDLAARLRDFADLIRQEEPLRERSK